LRQDFRKGTVQHIARNLHDIQIVRLVGAQPMLGYKTERRVEAKFDVKLRHGALYPLLKELECQSHLTGEERQQDGRTRKTYTTTKKGEECLEAYESALREQMKNSDVKRVRLDVWVLSP
jgi:DNA-binding PadR family transcriptional regulator